MEQLVLFAWKNENFIRFFFKSGSPLTMDQVQPNTELKAQIDAWVKEKLAAYKETSGKDQN